MVQEEVYTVFVHIVDGAGTILAQADHWPGGLPTDILDDGQVVVDRVPISLPAGMGPGTYDVRVGLYAAESGVRLPLAGGADHVILPVQLVVAAP